MEIAKEEEVKKEPLWTTEKIFMGKVKSNKAGVFIYIKIEGKKT